MKHSKRKWAIGIAVVLVAVVFACVLLMQGGSRQLTVASLSLDSAQASRGDISVTVHGTGSLEASEKQDVYLKTGGRVETIYAQDGDEVEAGELLFTLSNDDLYDKLRSLTDEMYQLDLELSASGIRGAATTVRAPADGRVKLLKIEDGDDLLTVQNQYGALMVLSTDGRMNVTVPAGELYVGQSVKVYVDSKVESGSVLRVEDGKAVVAIQNDSYTIGETAIVRLESGAEIGSGKLELSKPLRITGVSGKIRRVSVKENDKVDANEQLFTLEDDAVSLELEKKLLEKEQKQRDIDSVRRDIEALEVRAPLSGMVDGISVYEGMSVQEGAAVATVLGSDRMKVRLTVDELDIASVRAGQNAVIKLDALPGKTYTASVDRVLPLGTRTGEITKYDVILYMDGQDGMLPQMSASGDIEVDRAGNALLVPVAALQTVGTDRYVMRMPTDADLAGASITRSTSRNPFMKQNDAAVLQSVAPQLMVKVEVGLVAGEQAQILSGLSDGEEVVLARSGNSLMDTMMSMRSM